MDKTSVTVYTYNKCVVASHDIFMNMDLFNNTYDLFCEKVKTKNTNVLEIACVPCYITQYLLKKLPDFKILGIDLVDKMVELAKTNVPDA